MLRPPPPPALARARPAPAAPTPLALSSPRLPALERVHLPADASAAAAAADAAHTRRGLLALGAAVGLAGAAQLAAPARAGAITSNPLGFKKELAKKRRKIPESEYSDGPEGLKLFDITVGSGAEARVGERVAVHIDVKWRGVTFMTSRQGMGVTGGNPLGFDVGQPAGAPGSTLPGIDLGVRGMRVGGQRRLLVPPNLVRGAARRGVCRVLRHAAAGAGGRPRPRRAPPRPQGYGKRGLGEIPGDATLTVDVELLSIKTSPLGYRTKLIEG
ncbi:FKBP16-4 [Scenedesmus sp. PABB004]|nr:FKBP16-4 [Scenedesmus sp. PABB004]